MGDLEYAVPVLMVARLKEQEQLSECLPACVFR